MSYSLGVTVTDPNVSRIVLRGEEVRGEKGKLRKVKTPTSLIACTFLIESPRSWWKRIQNTEAGETLEYASREDGVY